jgi:hypothetical protein
MTRYRRRRIVGRKRNVHVLLPDSGKGDQNKRKKEDSQSSDGLHLLLNEIRKSIIHFAEKTPNRRGPKGCVENGSVAWLVVGQISIQICSFLPPRRRPILNATKPRIEETVH